MLSKQGFNVDCSFDKVCLELSYNTARFGNTQILHQKKLYVELIAKVLV